MDNTKELPEQAAQQLEQDLQARFERKSLQVKHFINRTTDSDIVYGFHITDAVVPPTKDIIDYAHQKILEFRPKWTIRVHV
jgi:hypothetical protein